MPTNDPVNKTSDEPDFRLSLSEAEQLLQRFAPGYRMVRSLGRGAYGEVFLARDNLKKMAVKIIPLAYRSMPEGTITNQEHSTRDWVVIQTCWERLHHSSLVRVRDYFLFEDPDPKASITRYGLITMDYWPWELKGCVQHLKDKQCHTPVRKRALLSNLANAVHRLQDETGLIITDLKPDNIVLNLCHYGSLQVGFIDTGSLFRQGAADYSRVDTATAYLAPELIDRKTTLVDEPALIYSFGLIGFLIMEGAHPFQEAPIAAPFHTEFSKRNGINFSHENRQSLPECVAILERCLREEPGERFQTFGELVAALNQEHIQSQQRIRTANRALVQTILPGYTPTPGTRWREPIVGMDLVWIPPGSFQMGQSGEEKRVLQASFSEKQYSNWFAHEQPQHGVELDGFWMSATPVTRGQWRRFVEECLHVTDAQKVGYTTGMGNNGWGRQKHGHWLQPGFEQEDTHPVVCISWFDAQTFAAWLSQHSGITYTLPSEAQWEYACRAGTPTPFYFGATLNARDCNHAGHGPFADGQPGEKRLATTPVTQFPANAFGLHDMHGNVWEWCLDAYDRHSYERPEASQRNPVFREMKPYRIRRGGAWSFGPSYLRSSYRDYSHPDSSSTDGGFRLIVTLVHGTP